MPEFRYTVGAAPIQPAALPQRALFLSDAHLGADPDGCYPDRQRALCAHLEAQVGRLSHLFIVGDLFEFWMEHRSCIPKGQLDVLCALRAIRRAGTEVHYLAGNHDFNLGQFFERELGLIVHQGTAASGSSGDAGPSGATAGDSSGATLDIELQGLRLRIVHGDGLASSDWKYRAVKATLLHPLSNRLWKLLHPDLGMWLARTVGSTSREHGLQYPIPCPEYDAAAVRLFDEAEAAGKPIDALLHGHTHLGFVREMGTRLYINTGEWLFRPQWIELCEGRFTHHAWE
jgi:UDP-2,3-diacylglucosamine hydrolase